MAKKADKTNAMRILDRAGVAYRQHAYDSRITGAVEVAAALGQDPGALFKTLVTVGRSGEHYVFMVPGGRELDLKKAAAAAGEKSLEMIPQKALLPLTGYVHGGCSPIGMKKPFRTFLDRAAERFPEICFSAGRLGAQIQMPPSALAAVLPLTLADLTKEG